ncbi:hypothetical protein MVLG_07003 [Microbotryum lychnidis-dioicae p1A1 Lamole]|uniref:Uncharacterized protein n=1 Tax=Microbotryum lychnidis-dioicae (strain p1A1 Lamole / MvSl-1064) TaxID=683840 RepID=U5HJ09_USTV1|nr:hypothetical protein MVLG_07003 [Microbotryum lychnidis-dioicae p1A1 Lamole]|eukprot:KDE02435.1 hypothetical protein MVLG_07003 [Microbotryum lychnidis-dioicae p1A1 Lamole]
MAPPIQADFDEAANPSGMDWDDERHSEYGGGYERDFGPAPYFPDRTSHIPIAPDYSANAERLSLADLRQVESFEPATRGKLGHCDLQRAAQAATTAGQRRENEDKERLELFNIVQRLHHVEERLFDPMASDEAKARLQQHLRAYQQEYDRTKELAASDFQHLCNCVVKLRALHKATVQLQCYQERIDSMGRGQSGATIGQVEASKLVSVSQTHSKKVKVAIDMYNKAVGDYRNAATEQSAQILDNLPLATTIKSLVTLSPTDAFWQDGFFVHDTAPWAIDTDVQKGIRAVLLKARAEEEILRIGAEVRQLLAWLEDEDTRFVRVSQAWAEDRVPEETLLLVPEETIEALSEQEVEEEDDAELGEGGGESGSTRGEDSDDLEIHDEPMG